MELTKREKEVVDLVTRGYSNKEIGQLLSITDKGVKFHLTNIFKKENVKSRAQLIVKYLPIVKERFKDEYNTQF